MRINVARSNPGCSLEGFASSLSTTRDQSWRYMQNLDTFILYDILFPYSAERQTKSSRNTDNFGSMEAQLSCY